MILGRPTNLWLGLVTAALGFVQVATIALRPDIDATQLGIVLGAAGLLLGSIITLVANSTPTLYTGDKVNIITPEGEPNKTIVV